MSKAVAMQEARLSIKDIHMSLLQRQQEMLQAQGDEEEGQTDGAALEGAGELLI